MKKYFVLLVLFLYQTTQGFSQKSLSDYSYIIVSEQFEFQDEKDKYDLNSLIKFLYNKHGFHAYFKDEVPDNVRRCDGLFADAEGKPGFLITKVEHVIRDCDGNEVFRSQKGKSDVKDYKKAYYEAAREAFRDVRDLYINQKPINTYADVAVDENIKTKNKEVSKVAAVPIVTKETVDKNPKEKSPNTMESIAIENLPTAKFSNYTNAGKTYLLRKTKEGYSFYEESNESEDGLLLIGKVNVLANEVTFTDNNNTRFHAEFDSSKNLIIDKEKGSSLYKLEN